MNERKQMNTMEQLMAFISECFYKPDRQAARIILGTAFAHYIPNTNPIWMFVVGPPSSGKTAITVTALSGLQGMFGEGNSWGRKTAGEIDEKTGMPTKRNKAEKDNEAVEILSTINTNTFLSHQIGVDDPGLLEQICGTESYKDKDGETKRRTKALYEKNGTRKLVTGNALVLIPDFTVMASMRREVRGEIMGQLRRIYDGQFEKKVGTRVTKIWTGKLSLLAATTPVIDKYTSIDSALGERFIQLNWRSNSTPGRGKFAIDMLLKKQQGFKVKGPMQKLIQQLFAEAEPKLLMLDIDHPVMDRLAALSELIAEGRTSVFGQMVDNKFVVSETSMPEDVYRIIQQFYCLLSGLCAVQCRDEPNEQDIQDVLRVGIETLPTYRSVALQAAIQARPLSDYAGKYYDKRAEAVKLCALGVIEQEGKGRPVKLRTQWQEVVDRIGFEFDTVFCEDGAAGERERGAKQALADEQAGATDEVF